MSNDIELNDEVPTIPPVSRRTLLTAAAGAIGAGLVATACGSRSAGSTPPAAAPAAGDAPFRAPTPVRAAEIDWQIAELAAGLEVLAVQTYDAALAAAGSGALGAVPPAVAEFVTVAKAHHEAHRDAWNDVLTGAGAQAITAPNATLKPVVDEAFGEVTDVAGAANLALMLEQIAAATYLSAQSALSDADAVKLAGSIQVIDAQHVAILLYALGQYPVPDVFAKTDMAASPTGATGGAMPPSK